MKFKFKMLLICIMLTFILTSCANNNEQESTTVSDNVTTTAIVENTEAIEPTEPVVTIPYDYNQKSNIIEDNYRNYYEIFVYSFFDTDGDGIGDLNGVIQKLDYVNDGDPSTDTDLGFNGIWLMPIMPSTTYHKYDVLNYKDIDPQYGTLEDFKNLVTECDKRGIKLIIDFVFNHSSSKHPWFMEAVSYLEGLEEGEEPDLTVCPYVGYYHFVKETNGNPSYYKAGSSEWYYEGMFWDQMPDLNLGNTLVRDEIEEIAKFWLDLGVDGFRLDAVKEFYSGEKERNIEVLKWFSDYVRTIDEDAYIVGEAWEDYTAISMYYESGTTSFFNFPLSQHNGAIISAVRRLGDGSATAFAKKIISMANQYKEKNQDFIDAPFVSNHDTTRISAQAGNNLDQMKMAAGVLLTMNGSPFVYYGEEIGMNSYQTKDENKRLPMNWSTTDLIGIAKKPSNADDVEQKFPSVEEQQKDPLSIYNYYRRAVQIRNENPEIARGEMTLIEEISNKEVCAISYNYEGSEIVIVYNICDEESKIILSDTRMDNMGIRGYLSVDGVEVTITDGTLNLPKYSIVILK